MKTTCSIAALLLACQLGSSVEKGGPLLSKPIHGPLIVTGNLSTDLFGRNSLTPVLQIQNEGLTVEAPRKSPWLAAGLSAVLPGAGEFYAESYWKAALFLAVDVAAWALAYSFDKKGDTQTEFFQNYADQHWSVIRYAVYADSTLAPSAQTYNWLIPNTDGRKPWERINWDELHRMERDIGSLPGGVGTYYSHTLPRRPEQQYYELIGKYHQYNQGWDDAPQRFVFGDPVTTRFLYYAAERGKANVYFSDATTFVTVALVNHVASAIDAAWTASSFNKSVHASMRIQNVPTRSGLAKVPVVRVEISF